MIDGDMTLDRTSKKIRSMSKVLPHLIDKDDEAAMQMLVAVLMEYLTLDNIDTLKAKQGSKAEQFTSKFYLERTIEIL